MLGNNWNYEFFLQGSGKVQEIWILISLSSWKTPGILKFLAMVWKSPRKQLISLYSKKTSWIFWKNQNVQKHVLFVYSIYRINFSCYVLKWQKLLEIVLFLLRKNLRLVPEKKLYPEQLLKFWNFLRGPRKTPWETANFPVLLKNFLNFVEKPKPAEACTLCILWIDSISVSASDHQNFWTWLYCDFVVHTKIN